MASFSFLKLPLLAQSVVINQIDLVAAIELSMVSKKFERVLQLSKFTVDRFEYSFKTDNFSLIIDTPSAGYLIIEPSFTKSNTTNIWNIDGNNFNIVKEIDDQHYPNTTFIQTQTQVEIKFNSNVSKLETLEKITGHLLKFLKVKNFKLFIKTNINILNLFIWKFTTRFDEFDLHDNFNHSVEVTPDEIKLLLETLTVNNLYLKVQTKNYPHFKYFSEGLRSSKIRKITIIESDWLEHDSLLNMAQESIQCHISKRFSGTANEILKKWISGENEKLEDFMLFASGYYGKCDQEQLLMGIKTIPSVFKLSEVKKRFYHLEPFFMMDIQREHDGCQATLIISYKHMQMLVWNEKHLKEIGRM